MRELERAVEKVATESEIRGWYRDFIRRLNRMTEDGRDPLPPPPKDDRHGD